MIGYVAEWISNFVPFLISHQHAREGEKKKVKIKLK